MTKKPLISKIISSSSKEDLFHGNYVLEAELDNGSILYYHNVKYKISSIHITYPNGNTKTFYEEVNSTHAKRNFQTTKYSEVMIQIKKHFDDIK